MAASSQPSRLKFRLLVLLVVMLVAGVISWFAERPLREHTPGMRPPDTGAAATTAAIEGSTPMHEPDSTAALSPGNAAPSNPPAAASPAPPSQRLAGKPQPRLEAVFDALHDYRMRFRENPIGTNAEITRALAGDNADEVDIVKQIGLPVNEKGELIDEWGTPLFLHQLSATNMEIRSAGPDRSFWNQDDVSYP
jgi:hypothetical protein